MSTPTVERTGDWDAVPFAGGFAGLHELADDEFSGMVTAGPARLFMLRGSVIGVLEGDIEDFAEADGTAREAPHPALPLLSVMQERSEEVRAEYYTEETPISEVDRTLSDGNFTGYIELAENVLSGDYYQVYHQGHSMSVAYVGAAERLIVDDEAFEQADDEVGIYQVRPVDVDVVEIPDPPEDDTASAADAGAGAVAGAGAASGSSGSEGADGESSTGEQLGGQEGTGSQGRADGQENAGSPNAAGSSPTGSADDAPTGSADDASATGNAAANEAVGASNEAESTGTSATDAVDSGSGEEATAAGQPTAADGTATDDVTESAPGDGADGTPTERQQEAATTDRSEDTTAADAGSSSTAEPTSDPAASAGRQQGSAADAGTRRQGRPAPDHPAAGSRGGANGATGGQGSSSGDALGAGDLEVRTLPSLDPERTGSASRQERRSGGAVGGAAPSGAAATGAGGGQPAGEGQQRSQPDPVEQSPDGPAGTGSGAAADPAQAGSETAHADAETAPTDADRTPTDADGAGATPAEQSPATGDAGGAPESNAAEQPPTEGTDAAEQPPADGADATASTADAGAGDLAEASGEVERLEAELADLQDDHEDVAAERDRLETELAEAREEIDRLRSRLEEATGQVGEAGTTLSPREAIDETNLFIRYDSKGEATLAKAHAGDVDKAAVDENLRLEYHTSFDAGDAAVDGVDFDTFLTDTVQYRFVDWLVRQLLYEIRDTGNTGSMADLYDALPKADRAELNGQVGVQYTEDGQEHRSQLAFDVIVRDRMGNPLLVANLNDSRDPATDSMMTDLVRAAERVGESSQSLAGAFLVTRSFFEPEALETAEEATAGGLLNRGKQKSFVNLSRKGGYHLCLVEARNQEFHLAVPEL